MWTVNRERKAACANVIQFLFYFFCSNIFHLVFRCGPSIHDCSAIRCAVKKNLWFNFAMWLINKHLYPSGKANWGIDHLYVYNSIRSYSIVYETVVEYRKKREYNHSRRSIVWNVRVKGKTVKCYSGQDMMTSNGIEELAHHIYIVHMELSGHSNGIFAIGSDCWITTTSSLPYTQFRFNTWTLSILIFPIFFSFSLHFQFCWLCGFNFTEKYSICYFLFPIE